ncbi:zinc-binding dehydrogenase [Nocardia sp. alder85J]|uniref:zinc-binding dehydrogenase n=1 Tax=Nocardia sp. alder85J TaxID=2862949 RepID=UPI001CD69804|nr:zinc-binding dehydrogenase [Nocardia sp. alder85J]MCX4096209.1 zinc-binding dehydrogenase [Nocardia sp. alder85J]
MRAVCVQDFGAPEVLVVAEVPDPEPGPGQVLVEVQSAGVGFGDVIVRSGRYPLPLPWIPGIEVAGRVVAIGADADPALLGRTVVATTAGQSGGYAERAVVTAAYTFPVPDGLDLAVALTVFQAGAVARGLTTAMRLDRADTVLITAAAGRIGSLLVQLAKAAGATVLGAASGPKLAAVTAFGADAVVDYGAPDWAERVRELTGGRGVDLLLDSVGGGVAETAFTLVADTGRIGLYGFASGRWPVVDLDSLRLGQRGLTLTGPLGLVFRKSGAEQRDDAEQALAAAAQGRLRPRIHATLPLERAAAAHRDLEDRRTVGAIVLCP